MNLFQYLFKKPKIQWKVKVVRLMAHEITLEHWKSDNERVQWARTSPEFSDVLTIVNNQQPTGFPGRGQSVSDIEAAIELGRKEGYTDCHNVLLALRQFPLKSIAEIEADYDDKDYSEAKD